MSAFQRPRSPYWWIWIPGAPAGKGTNPVNTKIPIGATATERKQNKQDAEQILAARLIKVAKIAAGVPVEADVLLFRTWAATYATHEIPQHRGAYRERAILPRLVTAFGDLSITAPARDWTTRVRGWRTERLTTPTKVAHYGGKKGKPHTFPAPSARTVNREVALVKQILGSAVRAGHLVISPLTRFRALKELPVRRRLTAADEEARLLAELAPDDRAIYLLGRDGLVRLGDCLDVRRADDRGTTLDIRRPKNEVPLTIPVSTQLRAALDAVPIDPARKESVEWYFWRRRRAKSEQDRTRGYIKALARACRQATPPIPYGKKAHGITFHWGTRMTGATRMIRHGGDGVIADVQKIGGWKDVSVLLEIYQQTVTEDMRRVVEYAAGGARATGSPRPPAPRPPKLRRVK